MKKLLTLLLLFICIEPIAQTQKDVKDAEAMYKRQGFFRPNTVFEKNKKYYSEDNRYYLVFQEDGNLVVYKMGKAVWHTHTNGKAIKKCVFQGDGNLVLYNYNDKAIWAAFTEQYDNLIVKKSTLPVLVMQSDGNLVIYNSWFRYNYNYVKPFTPGAKNLMISWSSGTNEKN
jgi:hypothetical protein